ncbi:unnamed protein product [Auanema sp. JU1783]|nr:unnamed protein product [Auanema sp. JU1783]
MSASSLSSPRPHREQNLSMRFFSIIVLLLIVFELSFSQRVFDMMDDRSNTYVALPREAYPFRRKMFPNPYRAVDDRWKKNENFE